MEKLNERLSADQGHVCPWRGPWRGPCTTATKLEMSSRVQQGQTTPTSHPLDPEEEVPKR